jgi:hypothetical protein
MQKITENKFFELQASYFREYNTNIFNFQISWSKRCDHAGFEIELSIWKFHFSISILDSRHWNYDKDQWYNIGESDEYKKEHPEFERETTEIVEKYLKERNI